MSLCREQFESRYPVPTGVRWNEETNRYALVEIKTARHAGSTIAGYEAYVHSWSVWKASREDVALSLPDRFSEAYQEYFDDVEGGCLNEGKYIADVRAAIESAGLRVSP